MVAIFYKNEKYTYYCVFLDQQKLESIIWFGNVAKRLRSFSFSTPPFSNAGPGPEKDKAEHVDVPGTVETFQHDHHKSYSNSGEEQHFRDPIQLLVQ